MLPTVSTKRMPVTNKELRLFALSADFPALVRAQWVASTIAKLAGAHWQASTEMWKMDSLKTGEHILQTMTSNAANADAIVIAVSSLTQRNPALIRWLDSIANLKTTCTATGLLIGLLGDETTNIVELDLTAKPLILCAQRMGWDFIWQWMGVNAINDTDWLSENVENLLARKLRASKSHSVESGTKKCCH